MRDRLRRAWFRLVGVGGTSRLSLFLHPLLYRWTCGIGPLGRFLGKRVGILTTVGSRTGKPRTAPIWIYPDGEGWVIVASRGGDQRAPAWYHNLRSVPQATLGVGRRRHTVAAREVRGDEYERLWAMSTAPIRGTPTTASVPAATSPLWSSNRWPPTQCPAPMRQMHRWTHEFPPVRRSMHQETSASREERLMRRVMRDVHTRRFAPAHRLAGP